MVDAVEHVAALEGDCDAHRYEALQTAFAESVAADALVVRELLVSLVDAMDAVENAGDYLLSMNSTAV